MRDVLADNLLRFMAETPDVDSQEALAQRAGVGQSTISRILLKQAAATLDVLESMAKALGREPWELLADGEATRQLALQKMITGPRVSDDKAQRHLPSAPTITPLKRKRS